MASDTKDDGGTEKEAKMSEPTAEDLLAGFAEDPLSFSEDDFDEGPHPGVEGLVAERDDLKDKLLRSLADAENVRKRAERERRDAEAYGGTKLARDLLPVYDNMNRALDAIDDDLRTQAAGLIEGIELVQKELLSAFNKHQIEKVEPEYGDKFDPNLHQAMFEAPVPNAAAGTIIQVMNPGFMISDRLLRPAQVGVSSTPAGSVVDAEPDEDA